MLRQGEDGLDRKGSLYGIRKLMESSFDPDVVGAIKMNEEGSDAVLIPNARPFHIMLSFGHRW